MLVFEGGELQKGAELQLEISEILFQDVSISGSLLIFAKNIMGHQKNNFLQFSSNIGKCILKNVRIKNKGIDDKAENQFWKNQITRKESFSIELEGDSLFFAENITLEGNKKIVVPHGKKVIAKEKEGAIIYEMSPLLQKEKRIWEYRVEENNKITLILR